MEYEVLGLKLKLKESEVDGEVSPKDIVKFVQDEAYKIKEQNPRLDNGQIGILIALDLAKEKMSLDRKFEESVRTFDSLAKDALELIETNNS